MGVLDDAIRDHLELKRRHGASDEEISRETAEALGPARREAPEPPEPEEGLGPVAEGSLEEQPAFEEGHRTGAMSEEAGEAAGPVPFDHAEDREEPREPFDESAPAETTVMDSLGPNGGGLADEPPAEEAEEERSSEEEPATEADSEETGEDVLEETPDFLQETPEHDRLWFEQKPPRDFDFDE